jgi:hypothetical protein
MRQKSRTSLNPAVSGRAAAGLFAERVTAHGRDCVIVAIAPGHTNVRTTDKDIFLPAK